MELEEEIVLGTGMEIEDREDVHAHFIKEKDSKSLANLISPVIKQTFANSIVGDQIFHQTQVDINKDLNKVKIESFLATLFQQQQQSHFMDETIQAIQQFFEN